MAALLLSSACEPTFSDDSLLDDGEWRDVQLVLSPDTGAPGLARFVEIIGFGARWEQGLVDVSLGEGVDVYVSRVSSEYIRAQVIPLEGAELGLRDLVVTQGPNRDVLRDAYTVQSGLIDVTPSRLRPGETTEIEIQGRNTAFQPGWTTVSLGEHIDVREVVVTDPERILVTVHVPLRAQVGYHDVFAYNPGGDTWTLHQGLFVDREALVMSVTPDEADQGTTINVRIRVDDGQLDGGLAEVDLGTGVVVESVSVLNPELVEARIRIGNNARVGFRDVTVRSTPTIGDSTVRILIDGFTIHEVPANPLRARMSISFGISRVFQHDSCGFRPSVFASAVIYEPNDFPCPSTNASSSLQVPPHFDTPGTGFSVNPGGSTDCPPSKTFDAGPFLELVSQGDTVELERDVNVFTGRVSYRATGLDVDDYLLDRAWGLETPGGDLGFSELPPWSIDYVLHSLKVDYRQHAPDYCGLIHPLDQPLDVVWDAAQTYDDAEMYLYLTGPAQDDGVPIMMLYPWDDGEFTYDPDALSFFTDGGAGLLQVAYRQVRFQVPGSELVNAGIGSSNLLVRGDFQFE